MNRRQLRKPGDGRFIYDRPKTDYFTTVIHHGEHLMVKELGIQGVVHCFWKAFDGQLSVENVRPLKINSDAVNMIATMPTDHYIHVYLEIEDDRDNVEVEDSDPIEVGFDGEEIDVEQSESDTEDEDFHESDYDIEDEDDQNFEVHVDLGFEMEVGGGNGYGESSDESELALSDSLHSVHESDDDEEVTQWPEFNIEIDMRNPQFSKGLIFASREVIKEAIRQYDRLNRFNIRFVRNDKKRVKAICADGCPWSLWAAKLNPKNVADSTWQIKTYVPRHNCLKDLKNRNLKSKFMAIHYLYKFIADPKYSITSLQQDVMKDFVTHVSLTKCSKARKLALEVVFGNYKEQYSKIYEYLNKLRVTNKGTTTICFLKARLFKRMYACLDAMKKGFKAGCSPIISLDGCFLKGYYGGHMLAGSWDRCK
ncbi:hypothetical protein PTKIN_Ptkin18bG0018100 [Pterospermum kingtungense]